MDYLNVTSEQVQSSCDELFGRDVRDAFRRGAEAMRDAAAKALHVAAEAEHYDEGIALEAAAKAIRAMPLPTPEPAGHPDCPGETSRTY